MGTPLPSAFRGLCFWAGFSDTSPGSVGNPTLLGFKRMVLNQSVGNSIIVCFQLMSYCVVLSRLVVAALNTDAAALLQREYWIKFIADFARYSESMLYVPKCWRLASMIHRGLSVQLGRQSNERCRRCWQFQIKLNIKYILNMVWPPGVNNL